MSDRSLDELTLRDKFRAAERATNDIIEHLDHGFIPKTHDLHRLVRKPEKDLEAENVRDLTIRNHAASILESDQYTKKLYAKMEDYFSAIRKEIADLMEQG